MLTLTQSQAERRTNTFPFHSTHNVTFGLRRLIYFPLKHCGAIRLLLLEPGYFAKRVSCTLTEANLDSCRTYAALSYVWGNPKLTVPALCNDCDVPITKNLDAALRRLRHPTEIVPCWVDALCINQSDIDERNSQVTLMGDIYSRALNVIIYLGEDDTDSELAFPIVDILYGASQDTQRSKEAVYEILRITYFRGGDEDIPGYGSARWDAFQNLFRRDWFSRIWVFQEAVLSSPDPWFLCGERKVSWERIASAVSAPNYRGEGPKLEKCPRSEGPRGEGEGESLRITRLGRGIRMYSVAEKCVDSNSKIYNFGSP